MHMRRMFVAMSAMALTLTAFAGAAESTATDALPPDLAAALRAYDRATLGNDTVTLAQLVMDDYMLVNSDSSVQDKESYLADFKVPGFKMDPYVMRQPMHKVWGNTALTGGIMPLGWTQEGKHQQRLLRIAHVWVKHQGQWRLTYTQLTRVPE
jgi:ketosteroid isomerase-like protein